MGVFFQTFPWFFREGYYYDSYGKMIVDRFRDLSDTSLRKRKEPTFKEFIKYILNTHHLKYDEHWKPIWTLCTPCVVNYDVIGKMETFGADMAYILQQTGLDLEFNLDWVHKTSSERTSDVAAQYYSEISREDLESLYFVYKLDFDLFDYDVVPYLSMGKANSESDHG